MSNAKTSTLNTVELDNFEQITGAISEKNLLSEDVSDLDYNEICWTTYLRLLVDTYIDPVTEQTVNVYQVYPIVTCIPMNKSTTL